MSTATKLTYLNTTKSLIKDNLNLGGANITNEPFRAYSSKLEGIYKDFLANGTDTLWNNWEKVSGSGTTLSLNNTIKGKMEIEYGGNTSQEGTPTPDSPIPINVVSGDNTLTIGDGTDSTTYPINLGTTELCKIGDYKDRIYYDNGKWYLAKYITKTTNAENYFSTTGIGSGNVRYAIISKLSLGMEKNTTMNRMLCNKFKERDNTTLPRWVGCFELQSNTDGVLFFVDMEYDTVEKIKEAYPNLTCYSANSTPTIEEITSTNYPTLYSQLEAIKYSYESQTNISQTNDDLPFELDVVALKELL